MLPRIQVTEDRTKEPSALVSELHPQSEDAEAAIPTPDEEPAVAAQTRPTEATEAKAIAISAAGVGANPVIPEWNPLTSRLEVGEDETGVESSRTEVAQVVNWQIESGANLAEEIDLLTASLADTAGHETRNPEHEAVTGRLVREVPVLEIVELLIAGTSFRSVIAESEAELDEVADRHRCRDAPFSGETAILGER